MNYNIYDNTKDYKIDDSGNLFWNIFTYATSLLYIYPKFFSWFQNKVITGLTNGNRIILTVYSNNDLAGYSILKLKPNKEKICTLQIFPQYRKYGYGRFLFQKALEIVKKPIITVSSNQIELYNTLLSEYNFSFLCEINNMYASNQSEMIFKKT